MTISTSLEAIKKRCEAATPGPWKAYDWPEFPRGKCVRIEGDLHITAFCFPGKRNNDAIFIAHSRTDIERLVKCVEVLSEEVLMNCDCYPLDGHGRVCRIHKALAKAQKTLEGT